VAVAAGAAASSTALIGFGLDSLVEASSALVVIWQSRSCRARGPGTVALKPIAASFFALAAWDTVRLFQLAFGLVLGEDALLHKDFGLAVANPSRCRLALMHSMKPSPQAARQSETAS
jgi:hypothetical protein